MAGREPLHQIVTTKSESQKRAKLFDKMTKVTKQAAPADALLLLLQDDVEAPANVKANLSSMLKVYFRQYWVEAPNRTRGR